MSLRMLLLICACICFILAAAGLPAARVNLIALGLAFWVLALIAG